MAECRCQTPSRWFSQPLLESHLGDQASVCIPCVKRRRAQDNPATTTLLSIEQQLLLYGKAARQHDQHPMRVATFCPGSLRPATERFIRKVGRPRAEWAVNVQCLSIRVCGSMASVEHTVKDKAEWWNTIEQFYKR